MNTSLVSVVLPVYNQEDHIHEIIKDYQTVLDRLPVPYEFVLVTNACKDKSPELCKKLSEDRENIQWVNLESGGWGRAVKHGLQQSRGDLLCYTNSARTSPEILSLTLIYAIAYPDVVVKANRKIRDSLRRRLGSLLYNLECRALFDLPTWDINGTPKIFPRHFSKLLDLERDDDLIDAEFNYICRKEGYPVVEVPVLSTRRHGGKSTTNYGSAAKMYLGVYEMWRRTKSK
ncbi:MAG: glycosyltransferase [Candidatus Obscuribacterales bacterium]|nr:glycosyltransferase [Candidatus Obscuribacterales bacterium]